MFILLVNGGDPLSLKGSYKTLYPTFVIMLLVLGYKELTDLFIDLKRRRLD